MILVKYIVYLLRFILSKSYKHNIVYRPTELECISNIEKEKRIINRYGINPHFTDFERLVYALDLYVKCIVIPKSIKDNLVKPKSSKVPIPIYWIAEQTSHSSEYIMRVLNTVDDKVFVRDKLKLTPILPKINKEVKELENMFRVKLNYEGV